MACCCLCFSQGSKSWIPLLLPIFAVFASFFSLGHGLLSIPITFSLLLALFSVLLSFKLSKQRKNLMDKEASLPEEEALMEPSPQESSHKDEDEVKDNAMLEKEEEVVGKMEVEESKGEGFLLKSQDLYSESESMDHFSSSSFEDHSSDIEWPYSMEHRLDCSDDSISDEESLIEIAIPSGEFVSPEKDPKFNLKCCKDFYADMNEFNEEDNLIEIDIYMGSIKCSSFEM